MGGVGGGGGVLGISSPPLAATLRRWGSAIGCSLYLHIHIRSFSFLWSRPSAVRCGIHAAYAYYSSTTYERVVES